MILAMLWVIMAWRLRPGEIFKNRNKVHLKKKKLTKQQKNSSSIFNLMNTMF